MHSILFLVLTLPDHVTHTLKNTLKRRKKKVTRDGELHTKKMKKHSRIR